MITRTFYLLTLLLICAISTTRAQMENCTLGVGGKDTQLITDVFQLNDAQLHQMELWIGELGMESKLIEDEIKELFDNHPQSTQEEMLTLAQKYKVLKDRLTHLSLNYDSRVLGLFNEKQYQRYVELCAEALRKPLTPILSSEETSDPE